MPITTVLYKYFVLFGELPLPGVGTLVIRRNPATHDIAEKCFHPPVYSFILENATVRGERKLFNWLQEEWKLEEGDAVQAFNELSQALKKELEENKQARWEGVGLFKRLTGGQMSFESEQIELPGFNSVYAEKVIHENSSHTLLVGDREQTSEQMTEMFTGEMPKKDYSLLVALILLILSIMFLGFHFSEKGLHPAAVANQKHLVTGE
ncbi:MAG: hypothetical protein GC171_10590 [Terrimonas sp.]|nr:hypothetical protein [Terrimonas sp.]